MDSKRIVTYEISWASFGGSLNCLNSMQISSQSWPNVTTWWPSSSNKLTSYPPVRLVQLQHRAAATRKWEKFCSILINVNVVYVAFWKPLLRRSYITLIRSLVASKSYVNKRRGRRKEEGWLVSWLAGNQVSERARKETRIERDIQVSLIDHARHSLR